MYSSWALHPEQQHHHSLNRLQYGSTIPHFYLPLSRFRLQFGFFLLLHSQRQLLISVFFSHFEYTFVLCFNIKKKNIVYLLIHFEFSRFYLVILQIQIPKRGEKIDKSMNNTIFVCCALRKTNAIRLFISSNAYEYEFFFRLVLFLCLQFRNCQLYFWNYFFLLQRFHSKSGTRSEMLIAFASSNECNTFFMHLIIKYWMKMDNLALFLKLVITVRYGVAANWRMEEKSITLNLINRQLNSI